MSGQTAPLARRGPRTPALPFSSGAYAGVGLPRYSAHHDTWPDVPTGPAGCDAASAGPAPTETGLDASTRELGAAPGGGGRWDAAVGDRGWLRTWPEDVPATSNQQAGELPFQRWYRFKEAFAPRFVVDALESLPFRPATCLDPFAGSGTTALTCQFLGVRPTTAEVNPFLADLVEAKLASYDLRALVSDRERLHVLVAAEADRLDPADGDAARAALAAGFAGAPPTFVEPGEKDRWIFDRAVALRLLAYRRAIAALAHPAHQRLFRVLLASVVVPVSNVVISGKGRRYRRHWRERPARPAAVDRLFDDAFRRALYDLTRFDDRRERAYTLLRGDVRALLGGAPATPGGVRDGTAGDGGTGHGAAPAGGADVALFSPPYPNSFDYTDVYNVELWALGYLGAAADNRTLREATFRSHVQIKRDFGAGPLESPSLAAALDALAAEADRLWNPHIPAMLAAYFDDLARVLRGVRRALAPRGRALLVVGDSRYAGVRVDVAAVVAELAPALGFRCEARTAVRSMRSSPQQGGSFELSESLLRLAPERDVGPG